MENKLRLCKVYKNGILFEAFVFNEAIMTDDCRINFLMNGSLLFSTTEDQNFSFKYEDIPIGYEKQFTVTKV